VHVITSVFSFLLSKNLKNKTKPNDLQGDDTMVYCTKCGTKNEDTALVCVNCGASLQTGTSVTRRYERRRVENECFGLPHGGAIAGIVIGAIILLWGAFTLAQEAGWITRAPEIWPFVIIIIGVLIILGALYRMGRAPSP